MLTIMKKFILLVALIFVFSTVSFAQIFEDGKPADLKNLKKVYITSDVTSLDYKQIRAEIKRAKIPGLKIVNSAEAADFSLIYTNEKSAPDTEKNPTPFGMGMVAMNSADGSKIRILMKYQSRVPERNTAVKFARKVIATYKKANGLK
jgi:preprotein translocase subunit SecF